MLAIPKTLHPENFVEAIIRIPFWRYFKSSAIIVSISVFFAVWINFILGYAFARMKAPGKDIWFGVLISLMMVPGFATSIPTYVLFSRLNITDSYLIWFLNGIGGSPFFRYLLVSPIHADDSERASGSRETGRLHNNRDHVPYFLAAYGSCHCCCLHVRVSEFMGGFRTALYVS